MKKTIAIILSAMLLLTACHRTDVDPAGSTAATQPTEETTQPTSPAQPDPEWLIPDRLAHGYAGFLVLDQEYSAQSDPASWTTEKTGKYRQFTLEFTKSGMFISSDGTVLYSVPNSEALTAYTLIGANGKSAYLRNDAELLEVDMQTGTATSLLTNAALVSNAYFCGQNALYYATRSGDAEPVIRIICRYRNETIQLVPDITYTAETTCLFSLHRPKSPKSCITWTQINPDMLTRLKAELTDPNSLYKTAGQMDHSNIWGDLSALTDTSRHWQLMKICYALQQDVNIPALLTVSYDPQSGAVTEEITSQLGDTDWMAERTPLSYEEYFSENRSYLGANDWTVMTDTGEKRFELYSTVFAESFFILRDGEICAEPWFSDLYQQFYLAGADGQFAYLYEYHGSEILQLDMLTHTEKTLVLCDQLLQVYLCDKDVLVYSAVVDGRIGIYRLYIPEMKLDLLYDDFAKDTPASWFELRKPASSHGNLVWTMMNPEMLALLQAELADPNSPFQTYEDGDLSGIWELQDPFAFEYSHTIKLICHKIQNASGVRAFAECTFNRADRTYSERFGIIDNCWFGTGVDHDHFNPEAVTPLPDPTPDIEQWHSAEGLPLPPTSADDPLYETYSLRVDDGKTVVLQHPDGKTEYTILDTADICDIRRAYNDNGFAYICTEDALYQLEIATLRYRKLLSYTLGHCIFSVQDGKRRGGSDNTIFFEVSQWDYLAFYFLHTDTGELEKIHFI